MKKCPLRFPRRAALAAAVVALAPTVHAQVSVLTYHNDAARTGSNTAETALSPASVNTASFGKLFSQTVDGQVYAQPLLVPNVAVRGKGAHNAVFVCTQADTVYAFDADGNSGSNATYLWKKSCLGSGETTVPSGDVGNGYGDITPQIGITGTPVIDAASGTMYVVAKTKTSGGAYVLRLHALDIGSGDEKFGGPVTITASVPGTGYNGLSGQNDAVSGRVPFNSHTQHQRPALLLLNGVVYIGFAAHEDANPYHGWVLGYDAATLAQKAVFCTTPDGGLGGIWQSGGGLASDGTFIYFTTGNGTYGAGASGRFNYGDSLVKLNVNAGASVTDWFTPYNQSTLNSNDGDVGSSGMTLLPDQTGAHPHVMVSSSKGGALYVVDRDNMGRYNSGINSQIIHSFQTPVKSPVLCAPATWNGYVYFQGYNQGVEAFSIAALLNTPTPTTTTTLAPSSVGPTKWSDYGASPSVSSSGADNGILWAMQTNGRQTGNPAILHAYNATDVSKELYNTTLAGTRDTLGTALKFTVPTVANGKVYVGTATRLDVLGLLNLAPALSSVASPSNTTVVAVFTRALDPASAQTASNYSLNNGASVVSATLGADGVTVTLATSPLLFNTGYTLTVGGVQDTSTPPHSVAAGTSRSFTTPSAPAVSLTLASGSVVSGGSVVGTVHLAAPAPAGGVSVALSTDSPSAITLPASVTVAPDAATADFAISTAPVNTDSVASIAATANGQTGSALLSLSSLVMAQFYLTPGSVNGGQNSTGTVTTNNAVPMPAGLAIQLSSDNAAATVPASVVVPMGQTTANFTVTTKPVAASAAPNITAALNGLTRTTPLNVTSVAGDVDLDGAFSISDVLLTLQIALGQTAATPDQLTAGDVNSDAVVGLDDAAILLRQLEGL